MHLMALHIHGSSNPLGITGNLDRIPMHSYFIFKDLVTVFLFMLILALFVFYSPNTLGHKMALLIITIIILYYVIIMYCAICWKFLYNLINQLMILKSYWFNNYKIYNKTLYYIYYKNNNKFIYWFILFIIIYFKKWYINIISDLFNPYKVKYYYKKDNQQVTNINYIHNLLVGTSETTRTHLNKNLNILFLNLSINILLINNIHKRYYNILLSHNNNNNNTPIGTNNNIKFNQWLAGLIDGNGYFNITKGKYPLCEILTELINEKILREIQNKFGGSIKLRAGIKTIRYKLSNINNIINLINAINGNIRNSKRLVQFNKVCILLNITFKEPIKLNINNAWFIGFFDANGTINYYYNNKIKIIPLLIISVTNKYLHDIEYFRNIFGGTINFDKSKNGYFKWSINNKESHNIYYNYNKYCPSKSYKNKRLFLINKFYYLYDLLAFKYTHNTNLYKAWLNFENKWNNIN